MPAGPVGASRTRRCARSALRPPRARSISAATRIIPPAVNIPEAHEITTVKDLWQGSPAATRCGLTDQQPSRLRQGAAAALRWNGSSGDKFSFTNERNPKGARLVTFHRGRGMGRRQSQHVRLFAVDKRPTGCSMRTRNPPEEPTPGVVKEIDIGGAKLAVKDGSVRKTAVADRRQTWRKCSRRRNGGPRSPRR